MGERIRAFNWSETIIGPVEGWPESLKTAVRICIATRNPVAVWWGPSFIQFYNDAYIPILGAKKHPAYLGRSGAECWNEIWETMGPMWERVLATGEATWSEVEASGVFRLQTQRLFTELHRKLCGMPQSMHQGLRYASR